MTYINVQGRATERANRMECGSELAYLPRIYAVYILDSVQNELVSSWLR